MKAAYVLKHYMVYNTISIYVTDNYHNNNYVSHYSNSSSIKHGQYSHVDGSHGQFNVHNLSL